jgi:hypothetical protein
MMALCENKNDATRSNGNTSDACCQTMPLETMETVVIDGDAFEVGGKLQEQNKNRRLWFEAGKFVPAFLEEGL